jgi:hypothetical protein
MVTLLEGSDGPYRGISTAKPTAGQRCNTPYRCLQDNQGFYTCIPCSPEQLQACADSEERERLIRQNVARLEAKRARDAHEAAQVELDAALSRAVQQGMASLAAAGTSLASNALAPAPESCDRVVRGGVDGCKQGVRAQVGRKGA